MKNYKTIAPDFEQGGKYVGLQAGFENRIVISPDDKGTVRAWESKPYVKTYIKKEMEKEIKKLLILTILGMVIAFGLGVIVGLYWPV